MPLPASTVREGYELQRPNRERASSKTMRAFVVFLLVASAALMAVLTVGGWTELAGMQLLQIVWLAIYAIAAYYVARWNRGVLPMMAAIAIILAIFCGIAGISWFERDNFGFAESALPADLLGILTLLLGVLQIVVIVATLRAFNQQWNIEVEVPIGKRYDIDRDGPAGSRRAATA